VGIDRITRLRTDAVRRLEVGSVATATAFDEPGAGEYVTGDLNLIRARMVVQYRIADPVAYAFQAAELEPLLSRMVEASLARSLSRRGVDGALRGERVEIAQDVERELGLASERYRLGISVLGVNLTDARPPMEVAPDFLAAQSAQSERDRRVREARTYEATILPVARASADAKREAARAQADRAIALANGRAARFLALVAEAERARPSTVRKLYLDALRDLLPRVRRKLVMTPDEPLDLSIIGGGEQ
jgi:membrane protease subunit HflK